MELNQVWGEIFQGTPMADKIRTKLCPSCHLHREVLITRKGTKCAYCGCIITEEREND